MSWFTYLFLVTSPTRIIFVCIGPLSEKRRNIGSSTVTTPLGISYLRQTIEIPLLNMEPFVFAVGHPKSIKELQEKYTDLVFVHRLKRSNSNGFQTDFAKKVQARNIPDSLQVLTESVDVAGVTSCFFIEVVTHVDALFTKQVMLTLEKYESTFQYAFVTDQSNINPHLYLLFC